MERRFLSEERPAGLILFGRNVQDPGQLRRLVAEARHAAGGSLLVLVDQEGGRVQRLSAPHWRRYPAARAFAGVPDGALGRRRAFLCARLIACDLRAAGANVCCAPVLDIPVPGADDVIGDRAFGTDADTVIRCGEAFAEGLLAGGVLPVMKHIPGHGRAKTDSHFALPVIDASIAELRGTDFAPFTALRALPVAMTAHVVLEAVDAGAPVTVSRRAVEDVIRGVIGFDGLLVSDDLSMRALSGPLSGRTSAAIAAGCDIVLYCNASMKEMGEVAGASPWLEGASLQRFNAAMAQLREPDPFDAAEAEDALRDWLAASA